MDVFKINGDDDDETVLSVKIYILLHPLFQWRHQGRARQGDRPGRRLLRPGSRPGLEFKFSNCKKTSIYVIKLNYIDI